MVCVYSDSAAQLSRIEVVHWVCFIFWANGVYLSLMVELNIGIIAEIPGLKKKQLNIEVEDGVLTISGDKHGILDDKGATVLRRELKASSFKRSFELGDLLDTDSINASFDDGILSISIDKIEPEKPKKKSVKIS